MSFPIRVLLVEDDAAECERLREACAEATDGEVEVAVAGDAGEARERFEADELDLVVYGIEDAMKLFGEIRREHPGVPVVVPAGAEALGSINELLALVRQEDPFGTEEERPMVLFFPDEDLEACAEAVAGMVREFAAVAALPVDSPKAAELSTSEVRAIQIFARRTDAAEVRITPLSGGLSGARTVIVDAEDAGGMQTARVVGKLAPVEVIPSAVEGYESAIPDLPAGLGAALAGVVTAGAGDTGAIFFQLAHDYRRSWFECLASAPDDAAASVERLHHRFAERYDGAPSETQTLGSVRRSIFSDVEMSEAVAPIPDTGDLEEATEVEVSRGIQHRDLHGLNVLVSDSNEPLLIDYDNYAPANNALDPLTLELSTIFHRDEVAQRARGEWPGPEQARVWSDLDAYLEGCPYPEAIRACRAWAEDAAASPGELAATLFSAAKRQFWFDNTDKDLAAALMEAAAEELR